MIDFDTYKPIELTNQEYLNLYGREPNQVIKMRWDLYNVNLPKDNKFLESLPTHKKYVKILNKLGVDFKDIPKKYYNNFLLDKNNKPINIWKQEIYEQYFANRWIKPNDNILELGGRYGIVSFLINYLLDDEHKSNHVVVEPSKQIVKILEKNRNNHNFNSKFQICNYAISEKSLYLIELDNELGSFTTQDQNKSNIDVSIKMNEFKKIYAKNFDFNVLIADCEGCLCDFFTNYKSFIQNLNLFIFERDNNSNCYDYSDIYKCLEEFNFELVDSVYLKDYDNNKYRNFVQVWIKKKI